MTVRAPGPTLWGMNEQPPGPLAQILANLPSFSPQQGDGTPSLDTFDTSHLSVRAMVYLSGIAKGLRRRDAAKEANLTMATVKAYRRQVEGFREAEDGINEARADFMTHLAKGIMQGAALDAAERHREIVRVSAVDSSGDLVQAAKATAILRASENVLKSAGVLSDNDGPQGVGRGLIIKMWETREGRSTASVIPMVETKPVAPGATPIVDATSQEVDE